LAGTTKGEVTKRYKFKSVPKELNQVRKKKKKKDTKKRRIGNSGRSGKKINPWYIKKTRRTKKPRKNWGPKGEKGEMIVWVKTDKQKGKP